MKAFDTGMKTIKRGHIGKTNNMASRSFALLEVVDVVVGNGQNNSGYIVACLPYGQNPEKQAIYRLSDTAFERGKNPKQKSQQQAQSQPPKFNPLNIDAKFKKYLFDDKKVSVGYQGKRIFLLAEGVAFLSKDKESGMDVFAVNYFVNVSMRPDRLLQGVFLANGYFDRQANAYQVKHLAQVLNLDNTNAAMDENGRVNPFYVEAGNGSNAKAFAEMLQTAANDPKEYKDQFGYILRFVGKLETPMPLPANPDLNTSHIVLHTTGAITYQSHTNPDTGKAEYLPITAEHFLHNFEAYKAYIGDVKDELKRFAEAENLKFEHCKIEFIPLRLYRAGLSKQFSISPDYHTPLRRMIDTYTGLFPSNTPEDMDVVRGFNIACSGLLCLTDDKENVVNGTVMTTERLLVSGLYTNSYVGPVHDKVAAHGAGYGNFCRLMESLRIKEQHQVSEHKAEDAQVLTDSDEQDVPF